MSSEHERSIMVINIPYTDGALFELERLIMNGVIRPEEFRSATLCYDVQKGLGQPTSEQHFPLRFHSELFDLYMTGVTAGYSGEGPRGTITALHMMEFDVSPEDKEEIFGKKKIHKKFSK